MKSYFAGTLALITFAVLSTGCAAVTTPPPSQAQQPEEMETYCSTTVDNLACRRANDRAGGYPFNFETD